VDRCRMGWVIRVWLGDVCFMSERYMRTVHNLCSVPRCMCGAALPIPFCAQALGRIHAVALTDLALYTSLRMSLMTPPPSLICVVHLLMSPGTGPHPCGCLQ
jgi:hypothetical protein